MFSLVGKKALIVGVANNQSIAWGCAKAMRAQGADLALTYLNDKAKKYVEPLAQEAGAAIFAPLDVTDPTQITALFDQIRQVWGSLDILVHSIAFCPQDDLHGRVVDCSAEGFGLAMDISVHSFLRLIKQSEPLMGPGSSVMTVTFHGSEKVISHYNIMGPVKAALESTTRYVAAELGQKGISVNALSPGPLATRAASGIASFDEMLADATQRAPTRTLATIEDIGAYAAFLASDEARNITGAVHPIDGGYRIIG
ncbi:enoyl-ACP reductase FabI [Pseudovibrio sp. Tun.PSC04-5.I4]|uniref:enoyl-ACP reductase FabI n=1 Tax=Pseudovibrio sp. Tun.PSC04-5.I4 TaxID=1798213 RepID=UPI000880E9FF|nr:enoyl-ACP reductase FabI [Pseudovibrio sp. Tun.PSC04-5.I4]SDQ19611.1 Enoyl-[acyl-carrier-protein] reductase [NADH] [Pseudovibrio sp. Tun.PSC04-5.I4]